MPQAFEHFVSMTSHHDRDALDGILAAALMDLVHPAEVTLVELVSGGARRHWQTSLRMKYGLVLPVMDLNELDIASLPLEGVFPLRQACVARQEPVHAAVDGMNVTLFPLSAGAGREGVAEIVSTSPLDGDAVQVLSALLRLYTNVHRLLDYSERDELTGLLNRKTFDKSFLKHVGSASEGRSSALEQRMEPSVGPSRWWVGMIDVDHFKSVNDRFGHLIGDEVLQLLARIIRSTFRLQVKSFRFGGEEFVVLLPAPTEEFVGVGFERLRTNVAWYSFPQVGKVTISIGFAEAQTGDSSSAVTARTDEALYFAKRNGRDQVQGHARLVRCGELSTPLPE